MLRRSNKLDIALREIDEAIEMSPGNRTFHHTRGVILRDLAMSAVTPELMRLRLGPPRWVVGLAG